MVYREMTKLKQRYPSNNADDIALKCIKILFIED